MNVPNTDYLDSFTSGGKNAPDSLNHNMDYYNAYMDSLFPYIDYFNPNII